MKTILLILALSFSLINAKEYFINKENSKLGFVGNKFLFIDVKGEFKEFSGFVDIQEHAITALKGVVKVDSVQSGSDTRDENIKGESLFDSTNYPNIDFIMQTCDTKAQKIIGILTLHGVSKQISLDYTLQDTQNGKILGLKGEVDVKKDFGMQSYSMMSNSVKIDVVLDLKE